MNTREMAIKLILRAHASLMRTARAVPEDKLEWQPNNCGRPVLNIVQECAKVPGLLAQVLESQDTEWFNDQVQAAAEQERLTLDSLDACEKIMTRNTERLVAAIRALPEEALAIQVTLPFGAGGDWTLEELMELDYWNTTYHEGQINYIQTLYGDRDMH